MYLMELPLRYLMDQLRKLCEAALVSGVRVTRENLFDLARWWSHHRQCWSLWWMCLLLLVVMVEMTKTTSRLAGEFSCLQPAAGTLLTKCSRFLRFFIVPLFLSLSFGVQYHFVFVHLGKNCPKTLGSSVTLIEKTLRHSRYFSL